MTLKTKKRGFSLVELMILLVVSGLVIAALVPVVTKKHFRLPSQTMHGAYMCYYKGNGLHETKWSGKSQQSVIFDRDTDNCVFDPPKKAAYFQVSAIGGGGGGGDAGYNGGKPVAGWGEEQRIDPFGLDDAWLKSANIDKDEFLENAGSLYGYARGADSGAGGDGVYMVQNVSHPCLAYVYDPDLCYSYRSYSGTLTECHPKGSTTPCSKTVSGTKTVDVYSTSCETKTKTQRGKCIRYANSADDYDELIADNHKKKFSIASLFNRGHFTGAAALLAWGSSSQGGGKGSGGKGSQGGHQAGHGKGGGVTPTPNPDPPPSPPPPPDPPVCVEYEEITITYEDCTEYKSGTEEQGWSKDLMTDTCSGETECTTSDGSGSTCVGYGAFTDECAEYDTVYSYSEATVSGNPGGSGAVCASTSIRGNLGLTGSGGSNVGSTSDGSSLSGCGDHFCMNTATAGSGTASCETYASADDPRVCSVATHSSYAISGTGGSTTIKATSASAGGGGGGRSYNSDGDYGVNPSGTAVDGTCSGNVSSTNSPCDTGNYGYCLEHDNGLGTEPDGQYYYQDTYDRNYLTYGNPGSPGEFKTVIVRSLKDVDTTIKIGRGGSAAALNLGQSGANGSPTSMGSFITANGGTGGRGFLAKGDSQLLPVYNKARYDLEHDCYLYDKWTTEKDADGNWKYPTERNRVLTNPPDCSAFASPSDYKYHIISGRTHGEYPTPIGIASSIMNFVFNTADNSAAIQQFIKYGRGGSGGGVEHRCWAGRWQVLFEKKIMEKTSIYADYESASAYAKAHNLYVPTGCRQDWSNIPATAGADGALLIRW